MLVWLHFVFVRGGGTSDSEYVFNPYANVSMGFSRRKKIVCVNVCVCCMNKAEIMHICFYR